MIGFCLLAGLGFAACARCVPTEGRWRRLGPFLRSALALVLVGLMLLDYRQGVPIAGLDRAPLPDAYPIEEMMPMESPVITALRRSTGPVLKLPVGPKGVTPVFHVLAMYRSIFHWRPLLNGYSSYWPVGFPERMALADRLPDPEALAELRRETHLETVVVRFAELLPRKRPAWADVVRSKRSDLRLVAGDGSAWVFAVSAAGPAKR
jgi:hypothetical protein